jgi:hypothetical protein
MVKCRHEGKMAFYSLGDRLTMSTPEFAVRNM